jgi:flagellar hook-associated protein 2
VDAYVKPFVETGGILVQKSGTIDNRIAQTKKQIENYDRQLISQEDDLKRKYGLMEGALNRMERTSGSIDQFNKNRSD